MWTIILILLAINTTSSSIALSGLTGFDETNITNNVLDLQGQTFNCPTVTSNSYEALTIRDSTWTCDSSFFFITNTSLILQNIQFTLTSRGNLGVFHDSSVTFEDCTFTDISSIETNDGSLMAFSQSTFTHTTENCQSPLTFSLASSFSFTETTFTNQGVSFSAVDEIMIKSSEYDTSCPLLSIAESDSVTIESSSWECSADTCIQIHATSIQVTQTSMQALDMDSPVLTPLQIIGNSTFQSFTIGCTAGRSGCYSSSTLICARCPENQYQSGVTWTDGLVDAVQCENCQLGAKCRDGVISANEFYVLDTIQKTYFDDSCSSGLGAVEVEEPFLCPAGYCMGTEGRGCTKGRSGKLCGECESGLYEVFGSFECRDMKSEELYYLGAGLGVWVILFALFVVFYTKAFDSYFGTSVYISLYFFQTMSFYLNARYELSSEFKYVPMGLNVFRFDLISFFDTSTSEDVYVFNAHEDIDIFIQKSMNIAVPVISILFIVLFNICKSEQTYGEVLTNWFFLCVAGIVHKAVELITCKSVDGDLVMYYDGTKDCIDLPQIFPIALLLIIIGTTVKLYRDFSFVNHQAMHLGHFHLRQFKNSAWYFSILDVWFRIIVAGLSAGLQDYPVAQPLFLGLISGIYIAMLHEIQPFRHKHLNRFKSLYFFMLTFMAVLNATIGVYVYESDPIRQELLDAMAAFVIFGCLSGLVIPFLILCFARYVTDYERARKLKQREAADRASIAVVDLDDPGLPQDLHKDIDAANRKSTVISLIEMGNYEKRKGLPQEMPSSQSSVGIYQPNQQPPGDNKKFDDDNLSETSEIMAGNLQQRYSDKFKEQPGETGVHAEAFIGELAEQARRNDIRSSKKREPDIIQPGASMIKKGTTIENTPDLPEEDNFPRVSLRASRNRNSASQPGKKSFGATQWDRT